MDIKDIDMKAILSKFWIINGSSKLSIKVFFTTMISALLSYYFMIVDGYTVKG